MSQSGNWNRKKKKEIKKEACHIKSTLTLSLQIPTSAFITEPPGEGSEGENQQGRAEVRLLLLDQQITY